MEEILDLITSRNYDKALEFVEKNRTTNPPFYDSIRAYIKSITTDEKPETLFSNLLKTYPKNNEPWKFLSIVYNERGYHKKSYNALKYSFLNGDNSLFVFKKLFGYNLYYKDCRFILKLSKYFDPSQLIFINSYYSQKNIYNHPKQIYEITDNYSYFTEFKKIRIKEIKDKVDYSLENIPEKTDYNLNGKLIELKELKSILNKDYDKIAEFFINYEFKRFFYEIANELYRMKEYDLSLIALNSYFIIHNNQLNRIDIYFSLFQEHNFEYLSELLEFKNDHFLNEILNLANKIYIKKLKTKSNKTDDYDDSKSWDKFESPNNTPINSEMINHFKSSKEVIENEKRIELNLKVGNKINSEQEYNNLKNNVTNSTVNEKYNNDDEIKIFVSFLPNSTDMLEIYMKENENV